MYVYRNDECGIGGTFVKGKCKGTHDSGIAEERKMCTLAFRCSSIIPQICYMPDT